MLVRDEFYKKSVHLLSIPSAHGTCEVINFPADCAFVSYI